MELDDLVEVMVDIDARLRAIEAEFWGVPDDDDYEGEED